MFGSAATDDVRVTDPVPGSTAPGGIMMAGEANDDTAQDNQNTNIRVAFCNRWDPVPRASTSYANWFVDNWNTYLATPTARPGFRPTPLPPGSLVPFGQIVVLSDVAPAPGANIITQAQARWLTPTQFRQLVYLDPVQHSMGLYAQRVNRL